MTSTTASNLDRRKFASLFQNFVASAPECQIELRNIAFEFKQACLAVANEASNRADHGSASAANVFGAILDDDDSDDEDAITLEEQLDTIFNDTMAKIKKCVGLSTYTYVLDGVVDEAAARRLEASASAARNADAMSSQATGSLPTQIQSTDARATAPTSRDDEIELDEFTANDIYSDSDSEEAEPHDGSKFQVEADGAKKGPSLVLDVRGLDNSHNEFCTSLVRQPPEGSVCGPVLGYALRPVPHIVQIIQQLTDARERDYNSVPNRPPLRRCATEWTENYLKHFHAMHQPTTREEHLLALRQRRKLRQLLKKGTQRDVRSFQVELCENNCAQMLNLALQQFIANLTSSAVDTFACSSESTDHGASGSKKKNISAAHLKWAVQNVGPYSKNPSMQRIVANATEGFKNSP